MAPVAHGLLSGHMSEDTTFVPDDWRHASSVFQGNAFRSNLQVVGRLDRFARAELRCSVSQLAVAWALAHPAVHVAIVGSRRSDHIADAVEAADVKLDGEALARIEEITAPAVSVSGPTPESM